MKSDYEIMLELKTNRKICIENNNIIYFEKEYCSTCVFCDGTQCYRGYECSYKQRRAK